jgi:hypothetical protein
LPELLFSKAYSIGYVLYSQPETSFILERERERGGEGGREREKWRNCSAYASLLFWSGESLGIFWPP